MNKVLSFLFLSLLISSAAFAECYKMRLGKHDYVGDKHQYICISDNEVTVWDQKEKKDLLYIFKGCTKTKLDSPYSLFLLDGTAVTIAYPYYVTCKNGLEIAYSETTPEPRDVGELFMNGLLYTISKN